MTPASATPSTAGPSLDRRRPGLTTARALEVVTGRSAASVADVVTGWSQVIASATTGTTGTTMATLHSDCGVELHLDPSRWHDVADVTDLDAHTRVRGSVLDVGSGPGRLVTALSALGVQVRGIDVCPAVVALATSRGADTLHADVFDDVPGAGSWTTVLLMDGNIGIGGDPDRLLSRLAEIATPEGRLVVELASPSSRSRGRRARVAHPGGLTEWFPWAVVTVDELPAYAARTGWAVAETWCRDGRWFSVLTRPQDVTP